MSSIIEGVAFAFDARLFVLAHDRAQLHEPVLQRLQTGVGSALDQWSMESFEVVESGLVQVGVCKGAH